ncbi:Poly(3-hydroxyalkanoate) polymerase subunit PhaC [Methylocella tundrae]|uniref:Poly(3-hydroxyalkanoate) polymerase subunit PhaC n=1 Tax=Methylocella tundrae TaxID=227605 RepID=A0A8B6MA20_METTU|nr:class I poly(R)-hydroxyalkanoic acid synthase [Methylocella tundrae]VTZ51774.1 Poly(3-hydroxyalkanoate) polymerase subunit PhaC [Methylocella tundrae]
MSSIGSRRGGESGQSGKTKAAGRKKRAKAAAEKKLSASQAEKALGSAADPNGREPSSPTASPASSASPPVAPGVASATVIPPGLMPPALAALAPGLAKLGIPMEGAGDGAPKPDLEQIAYNMARLLEHGGKALAASLKPPEPGETKSDLSSEMSNAIRSISKVAEHWLSDPKKTVEAQSALVVGFLSLLSNTLRRLSGEAEAPVVPYDPSDKRFTAPEWRESLVFDFLRQAHAIAVNWANAIIDRSDDLDLQTRSKAKFYFRQISSALAPSNFFATNPEVLKETWASNGENLVRGAAMLARDLEAGKGRLKITRYDASKFEVGKNLATTPGKVIFRNELIELIQYSPTTETVYKRPLLIVPPWINKFYILDLTADKSFVRYAVSQGLTVFMVSWVNPDSRHRDKGFEDYMREGIFAALEAIEKATGETNVTAIGYCIGGTLLSMTLAYMAEIGDKRIESASFFTTQTDFSQAGDLKIFIDEEHLRDLEQKMASTGYLEASAMSTSFNMLRPEDLIWSFVVNNYMKGKPPLAFDLLAWNSDSTRMTAANHITYLRDCYLENRLARGKAVFGGKTLNLKKITIPVYHLATREDHIAPARSVFIGAQMVGGDVRYVLAGSGHIAGVINSVAKPKYQYWIGDRPSGAFEEWLEKATEHPGSWWPDWLEWVVRQSPERAPARIPGSGELPALCDAPGEYVKIRY